MTVIERLLKISLRKSQRGRIIRLEPWRKVVAEGFELARRPDFSIIWLQDLLPATLFCDRYRREKKVPLTLTTILIRACALTLHKNPLFHSWFHKGKLFIPSSIDIGITLDGREILAPVVVINQADTKSLQEITAELREKGRRAGERHRQDLEQLNKIGTWIPSSVRKMLIAWVIRRPDLLQKYVGTFQISALAGEPDIPGFGIPNFLVTSFLMGMYGISKRPVVVQERLELRPTANLLLAGEHKLAAGRQAMDFVHDICRLLANPEELDN